MVTASDTDAVAVDVIVPVEDFAVLPTTRHLTIESGEAISSTHLQVFDDGFDVFTEVDRTRLEGDQIRACDPP
jgi:hypothetical protein